MADFTLTVKTDSSAELLDIVARIANSMPLPIPHEQAKVLMEQRGEAMSAQTPAEAASTTAGDELPQPDPELVPERDAHGIKRDLRIHADAKDPLRASDNLWKRRKNVPDEQYEEIHLELVREAKAAGLYTGPAIPALELEEQMGPYYWSHPDSASFGVVDTLAQLEEMLAADGHAVEIDEEQYLKLQAADSAVTVTVENNTDAQLEVTQQPETVIVTAVAPPAPAPAPVPAAPAAPGMSAEATPTMQQVVVKMFHAAGVNAMQEALKAMKLSHVGEATPQQLRDLDTVTEMVKSLNMPDADKPTKGPEHTREALAALGYVA